MSRSIKWILAIAVLAALIYVALVAVTGAQMRSIAEQQLAHYDNQNPEVSAQLEWQDTSFRRSLGELRLELDIEGELLEITHSVVLTHGALRAKIEGEATAVLGDFSFADTFFDGAPLTLAGRVGLAGVTLSYQVPELRFEDDDLQMKYHMAPFAVDIVLREKDQHSHTEIAWIEIAATVIGATDVMRWEGITLSSQTRLDQAGGQFEHGLSRFNVASLTFGDYVESLAEVNDIRTEIEAWRENDLVRAEGSFEVTDYDVYGVAGELGVTFNVANVPFTGFRQWQQQADDQDALNHLFHDMQQQQTQLSIENLKLTMGEMGNLQAQGHFEMRDDIDFLQGQSFEDAAELLQGRLLVEDLPLLLLMPLSGLVSGELPWTIELREGNVLINGEALELP